MCLARRRRAPARPPPSRFRSSRASTLRSSDLFKKPGIAETVEWSRALLQLDAVVLDPRVVDDTLGVLLKYQDDIAKMAGSEAARLLKELREATA